MPQVNSLLFNKKQENYLPTKEITEIKEITENKSFNKNNKTSICSKMKENTTRIEMLIIIDFLLYLVTSYYSVWHTDVHNKIMASGAFANKPNFGLKYKYLTVIGDHLTPLFFFLSLIFFTLFAYAEKNGGKFINITLFNNDWKLNVEKILIKYEIFMRCFNIFLTTMNSMIAILFWTIYFIRKEFIMPKKVEKLYPLQLNLFIHGVTGIIMWWHNYICIRYKVYNFKYHRWVMFLFNVGYLSWVGLCYFINGWWAYDFLNYMNFFQHVLFICATIVACMFMNDFVCYFIIYIRSQRVK